MGSFTDRLLPSRVIGGTAETYRRGRLVVYAVIFCVLTPLPVALVLAAVSTPDMALRVLLGAVPSAATLALLWVTGSTRLAGHYLTGWVFLQTAVDFGHDTGFSLLAIFAIPILACALVGERAGAIWTLASVAWVVSIGVTISPADPLYFGLVWSSAIVVAVVGSAVIVLEFTRSQARLDAESASIELLSQRERLRAFAERSFPAMAETDGPHLTYVSEGIQDALGYTPEEFVQRRLTEYVHPEEFPGILEQLNKVGSQGMRCEVRLRHAKGHWVWLEAFAIPYGPGENRWIFAGRDIGEEKQQRETLQQAQRLESAGLVAAGMAHDFNNLLTVILGYSELLPPGESKKEIIQATDQAAKLTRQLLTFARVDGLEAAAVDVEQLMEDLQPMLRSILGSSIELELSSVAKTTSAAIAAGQLQQVLVNLCSNAKEAMPHGGRLAIDLSDHRVFEAEGDYEPLAPGTYLEIAVTDTGVGMDEHVLKHAFDPFFSTKEGRRRSGLGLASVYGIVTNAGGRVTLSSALGVGSRVSLMLPTAADSVNNPDVTLDLVPTLSPSTNYTILVIEDDISVRTLLAHSLERAGYTVVIARDGFEALSLANTLEPDLLVTDVVMPGLSGMQIAARLRERFPRLRTLYTSGYAEKHIGEWQSKANTRFLAKPFRSTDLIRAVQRILNGHNGKEAASAAELAE